MSPLSTMALELYRKKRDFGISPEPRGRVVRRRGPALAFYVQKHAASHLHYDFRMELDGVLLSWAVPKGPSLDPNDKRLAMHVEDHPLEYGDFEGVIPPKQYGSGTVLLWDRGSWHPKEDPQEGYRRGKLKFSLKGEKLRGGWTLVRSHGRKYGGGKAWLLIKEDDQHARRAPQTQVIEDQPNSVASGRSLEEIAADPDRVWHSDKSAAENVKESTKAARSRKHGGGEAAGLAGAKKAAMPALIEPQLATLVKAPVGGAEWLHEIKYDGYRMLCRIDKGAARIYSRNARDWTEAFSAVARAAARLPVESAWLDGEVVMMDAGGRSSFRALQNALSGGGDAKFVYFLFDLLYLDGYDLRKAALIERKRLLEAIIAGPEALTRPKAAVAPPPGMLLRYSSHVAGSGAEFYSRACRMKLEGVVSKRADSTYTSGRGRGWLKVKCGMRQELVIGGYTDPEGSRSGFGALLLGVYEAAGTLRYAGKVGTGFDQATLASLHKKLRTLVIDEAPFGNPPKGAEARRSHWVRPQLVAEIEFTEWTENGTLRHPSFQGLREDKKATDVRRESAAEEAAGSAAAPDGDQNLPRPPKKTQRSKAAPEDAVAGIVITHPDKLLYPDAGLTKLALARFYETIGDWLLPHLRNRPLTLVRCPDGWQKTCFFQKNAAGGTHPALDRVKVRTSDGPAQYLMANSVSAIVATLQMGALELHPWGATSKKLAFADRITFDLDPADDLGWGKLVEAATLVRTLLGKIGLQGFAKTTGGKGLHVVVPVQPTLPWDAVKGFSKAVAELLCQTFPERFTPKITKSTRQGRIFIDYLRNAEGATAVAAYSLRARAGAPVATPIAWEELKNKDLRFDHFTAKTVPTRLKRLQRDPWADFFTVRQSVTRSMMNQVGYSVGAGAASGAHRIPRRRK